MNIDFIILIAIFGFIGGWVAHSVYMVHVIRKFHQEYLDNPAQFDNAGYEEGDLLDSVPPKTVLIEVSKINGIFYVHNKETSEFLAQGATYRDVQDALEKRFPNVTFVGMQSNMKDSGFGK